MIDMAKADEATMTKIVRVVGWIAMCAGWVMMFSPFTTALSVLPVLGDLGNFAVFLVAFIVSCTCCLTVMTVAYIRYCPFVAILLLGVSLGIWAICAQRLHTASEEGGSDEPTEPP